MKKYFIFILILFGIFIGGIFLPKKFGSNEEIIFQIQKGQSLGEISTNLEKEGIIGFNPLFRIYVFFRGVGRKLQAGCYFLSPSMNIPKIAKIFASGNIAKTKITIPEGFTVPQIKEKFKDVISAESIPFEEYKGYLPPNFWEYEGYLFPDTYEVSYGMEEKQIIEMMLDNFNRKTANLRITPEIIIMASILEKEVKTKEEKELAAGVLWKRLEAGMPLQVDAEMWTYENYGLPKKPISNPGLESILAALYPKESQFWYYLSTPEGTTIFNKTLEEHNVAKAKYLK